jgi:bifunctional pyridoxal-dependent enzyme with beta-cystathionase and maltose regulon repressor activities
VEHDLIVLTDEIYSELTYDHAAHFSIAALPGMRDRCVFLHGFSKAFAMTGWRIGYACAPAPITDAMMKIHQYAILCTSTMAQDAAIEALEHGAKHVEQMRTEYQHRRNLIVSRFNELGLPCFKPVGAFYVFPDVRASGLSSREFLPSSSPGEKGRLRAWRRIRSRAAKGLSVLATRRVSSRSKPRWTASRNSWPGTRKRINARQRSSRYGCRRRLRMGERPVPRDELRAVEEPDGRTE